MGLNQRKVINYTCNTFCKFSKYSIADPHVRIAGREEDVLAAKERIMTTLDTRVYIYYVENKINYIIERLFIKNADCCQ